SAGSSSPGWAARAAVSASTSTWRPSTSASPGSEPAAGRRNGEGPAGRNPAGPSTSVERYGGRLTADCATRLRRPPAATTGVVCGRGIPRRLWLEPGGHLLPHRPTPHCTTGPSWGSFPDRRLCSAVPEGPAGG